ncbi:MAG: hypothetical protein P8Y12_00425 [Gammaproteobacteria bacterium]
MDKHLKKKGSIFGHWYWIWLVSAFFVSVMVVFFFFDYPGWFHFAYRGVSLSHEMNYAVWWSGICLFLAAIVFATAGIRAKETDGKAWVWYILALAMLALCYDEVGSLHETVARVGGWWGLLPFALGFAIVFGVALYELVRNPATRITAALIVIGIGIFVGVAGLEVLEHDAGFQHNFWRRVRLVGEEAVELVAMGVLITSGLIALVKMGIKDTDFLTATAATGKIMDFPLIIFTLFVLQLVISAAVIVPNYTFFPEGNPSALFPMLLFFCLSIVAMQKARKDKQSGYWKVLAVLFMAASILQMYNLNTLFNNLTGLKTTLVTGPPLSWAVTAIPLGVLCFYELRAGRIQVKRIITLAVSLFLIYLLVFPDLEFRYRIEYLYFLFSSAVAYSCYQVMSLNQGPER